MIRKNEGSQQQNNQKNVVDVKKYSGSTNYKTNENISQRRYSPNRNTAVRKRSASSQRKFKPEHKALYNASEYESFQKRKEPETQGDRNDQAVRFVPLGGLEEIGRNCMFFEYKNEIIIIDMGLQFPEEETPGIDYIIPNISYLEKKKANIQAIIITHGHYDHIGAIPHVLEKLGNPPIYTTAITKGIIEKRQEDFPNSAKPKIQVIKGGEEVKLSNHFSSLFFAVPHTIPESAGILLKTPVGNVVHFGDFRVDYDENDNPQNLEEFEKVAKMGVTALLVDSTNAERPGHSLSEKTVEKNLEMLLVNAKGRVVVATFSSLLTRIGEIIKIAEKLGKKVAFSGYSMKSNVSLAQNLGYIKAKEGTIIPIESLNKFPDNKIVVLSTGAQGEPNASLMKIINGDNQNLRVKSGDTFILSASVIPGNERGVQYLKDNLSRQGAVVYHSNLIDIHASGHALKEDIRIVTQIMKPKFFIPVHGYYFMRSANTITAQECGIKKENTFLMDNGQIAEMTSDSFKILKETIPSFYVMVDGLGVGDVEEVVLRDRRMLAEEGMLVVILTIDRAKGRLLKNPDIISRGFIYLKENQDLLEEIRKKIRTLLARIPTYDNPDPDYLKTLIRDQIGQFLYSRTKRRPMILPVIIEI